MVIRLVRIFNQFQNTLVSSKKLDFKEYERLRDAILNLMKEIENEHTCKHCKSINRNLERDKPINGGANSRTRVKTRFEFR